MSRITAGMGIVFGITTGLLVTYCMQDEVIRQKVKESGEAIGEFVRLAKEQADKKQQEKKAEEEYQIRQNQQWADQQWEALGI